MSENTKEQWEIAKYLIDAKKEVDALWYISKNVGALKNLNLYKVSQEKQREFYLNCRTVIDKTFKPAEKKKLKEKDAIIKAILYEADLNSAHKDSRYKATPMASWKELLDRLKEQTRHLRQVCAKVLPESVTIDFVPHDKELFRQVHKISPEDEEEMKKARHPEYGMPDLDPINNIYGTYKVLYDIEQLKEDGGDPKEYGVILENGLNLHEGLQNRQDWCITCNFLHGWKMWVQDNPEAIDWDRNKPCYCMSGKKYKNCCIEVGKRE